MNSPDEEELEASLLALQHEVQVWTEIEASLKNEGFRGKEAGAAAIVIGIHAEVHRLEEMLAELRKHLERQN